MSKDLKALARTITLWNESRLDLFGISQPNKNLEFHGVIRFYHQDSSNDGKYATKCVRVSSTASTLDVIETLSEKFRSDMRMLTKPHYGLYEVHVDGESRKLKDEENPLIVQLGWIKDDREGRFLLRNEDDKRPVQVGNGLYEESEDTVKGFKLTRNLTKKEKKQKKKKEKEKLNQKNKDENVITSQPSDEMSAAKQLYNQVPESTFTRTVSNPEAVMKKRREQKLQKRGAEMLKIYGDSINREIPYKTLLLLPNDKTDIVIRDTLDKYGLGKENTADYMIVQVVLPPGSKPEECFEGGWGKETVLDVDDCPLDIEQKWQPHQGTLVFQLRHRTASNHMLRKKRKTPNQSEDSVDEKHANDDQVDRNRKKTHDTKAPAKIAKKPDPEKPRPSPHPKFLEILGAGDKHYTHHIAPNVTEVGSDRRNAAYGPFIELHPTTGLMPSHCVITNMDGVVTVTPHDGVGEVFVDGNLIEETTMLSHADIVWLGRNKHLVFCDPGRDIPIADIQRKIRATVPKNQPQQNRSRKVSAQNPPSGLNRQRDGSSSDVAMERPRHHSAASSTSSKSSSLPHNTQATQQDRSHLQNIPENRNYQRNYNQPRKQQQQTQLPLTKSSGQEAPYHRGSAPPLTAAVQPIQHVQRRLPASLRINQEADESLITEILSVRAHSLHFKLSPAYSIYMMQRCFIETHKHKIIPHLILVTDLLEQTIQMNSSSVSELSFWMANTSELLNFIRQDQDLAVLTLEMQDTFAKTVQLSFRHLVQCMQRTLFDLMPAFLSESDEDLPGGDAVDLKKQNQNTDDPTMYDILHMLSSAMSLLRRCRVNAALTIQLFSQLFHSINMWLFNRLVSSADSKRLCCREWGIRIRARLAMVETWAEKQGLELAADCHLARITQATHLLQARKLSDDDIAAISGTCFKLNSLQLRALLSNYRPHERDGERRISQELINKVVAVAENSADELTRSDGRDVRLQEDPDLQLPFLLPEDGYSCDVVHGVPSGLTEFIDPFAKEGFCTYHIESESSDSWTVHFQTILPHYQTQTATPQQGMTPDQVILPAKPDITTVTFNKRGGGMGLSIVAARGSGQDKLGIYIRSVVKDGASDLDGRLQAGDQLLSVDGHSLVGLDQAKAAALMTKTGQTVTLEVAKQGAVYHGLATLLSQPSPKQQHVSIAQRRMNAQHAQPRPKSDGYALYPKEKRTAPTNFPPHSPVYDQHGRPLLPQGKQSSSLNYSTPQLNENYDYEPPQRLPNNAPRSAMSMGNLQQTASDAASPRGWRKDSREAPYKPDPSNIANTRRRATSQTVLTSVLPNEQVYNRQDRRQDRQNGALDSRSYPIKEISSVKPPKQELPPSPVNQIIPTNPPVTTEKYPSNALDNPNYDHFPPPPPDLAFNDDQNGVDVTPPSSTLPPVQIEENQPSIAKPPDPVKTYTPPPQDTATKRNKRASPSPVFKKEEKSSSRAGSQTLGRPGSGRRAEVAKAPPTQKKKQTAQAASKSATLPRHFKSSSPWERDEREKQEQSIQEQLNALRDEEISELSARSDLSSIEKDRLKNLLQERDFQARVQEEKMKMFSDEDISEEDYSVPDRPDRDRLIRLEGAHAQRDAEREVRNSTSEKEDRDRILWEEEQKRKKEEAELRAKQESERREERRRERERMERERQEERRRKEDERKKAQMYEEEQERLRQEHEMEEANDAYLDSLQREENEQRRRLEELRRMREEEENQLRELQAKREAEERSFRFESDHRRRQEKLLKQREADAREEAEREFLEAKLSQGKSNAFTPGYKKSYGPVSPYSPKSPAFSSVCGQQNNKIPTSPTAVSSGNRYHHDAPTSRPVMRDSSTRSTARPVSDGYMLGKNDWANEDVAASQPAPSTPPLSGAKRPVSYVATMNTPGVIGSQELYNDPRYKREANLKRDQSFKRRGPDPSRLTFKDRQRLFQGGSSSPVSKPKSSKKLLQIEESLRDQI